MSYIPLKYYNESNESNNLDVLVTLESNSKNNNKESKQSCNGNFFIWKFGKSIIWY